MSQHTDSPSRSVRRPRGARLALGLVLAIIGAVTVTVPTGASAAPQPTPTRADGSAPASIGGKSTGSVPPRENARTLATGIDLCAEVGKAAGFSGNSLVTAVAIAMAESSCNPSAIGYNPADASCPSGSVDRGLWQINSCWHPEVSDTCAYQSQCNAHEAYRISYSGTYWSPWSTYNGGQYRAYLPAAQAAVDRLGGGGTGGVTGTILANPSLNVRSGPYTSSTLVGQAYYGDVVTITCYTFGDYVSGGYWPSSTWDRITDPVTGASGYAADTWISTTYDVKSMVGPC